MATRIDEATFVKLVREQGLVDEPRARHAIVATLDALGAHVPEPERDLLGLALPQKFAHALAARRFRGPGNVAALEKAVMKSEHEKLGFAREEIEIVCGALGELLPEELATRVERTLEPSIAALFQPVSREVGEPPPYELAYSPKHHTLATGRPGSEHPVSSSGPKGAQTESVAAANPHEDTKLSSAHGETQEREEESLATAHPRSDREIAESHD
jgi:uncharacterized protein (DUF2267 family)